MRPGRTRHSPKIWPWESNARKMQPAQKSIGSPEREGSRTTPPGAAPATVPLPHPELNTLPVRSL